jgi:hypothetical protein
MEIARTEGDKKCAPSAAHGCIAWPKPVLYCRIALELA